MSFGISKTIPAGDGREAVDALYDGSLEEFEFHMAGQPSKLNVGDYVYTIFGDELIGRCQIVRIEGGAVNPSSGKPRTLIYVRAPGERLRRADPHEGTSRHPILRRDRLARGLSVPLRFSFAIPQRQVWIPSHIECDQQPPLYAPRNSASGSRWLS